MRLLGLNIDCVDQLKEEEKFLTFKTVPLENKKLGIEVVCRGEKLVMTPEQVVAAYIKKVMKFYEKANIASKDVVFSVPSYFSNVERQAFLDACDIAEVKAIRLLNEGTAAALSYGFFKNKEFKKDEKKVVAFVDFGHSKLTVTLVEFQTSKLKILYHHSDRNLGARNLDEIVLEKLGQEFLEKFDCDPRKNVKCRLRMLDVIEKQRKILSAN